MQRLALICLVLAACGGGGNPDGVDGSPGDDTGGDDAPGPDAAAADDRLNPLAVDRTWTYAVTSTYPSCPAGQRTQRVLATATTEGRPTFELESFCGGESVFVSVDGDVVDSYYDWGPTGWYRMLDEPVEDGHTWTTTNGSATFTQTYDDVGTHDGYSDCWKVTQNVSYTSYWIYCRGVGMVFSEMIDLGGGTIRTDLVSTSF
jgi:hypothetical protein